MSTAPPRKGPRSCRRTGCAGFPSCQSLRGSGFTTQMSWWGATSTVARTQGRSGRPTSNRGITAAAYDREVFLVMKEFEPAFSYGGDMAIDALAGAPVKELQRI